MDQLAQTHHVSQIRLRVWLSEPSRVSFRFGRVVGYHRHQFICDAKSRAGRATQPSTTTAQTVVRAPRRPLSWALLGSTEFRPTDICYSNAGEHQHQSALPLPNALTELGAGPGHSRLCCHAATVLASYRATRHATLKQYDLTGAARYVAKQLVRPGHHEHYLLASEFHSGH